MRRILGHRNTPVPRCRVVAIILLSLLASAWGQAQPARKMTAIEALQLFQQVLVHCERAYYRKVETPELIKSAIDGMLNSLDPYSEYLEPEAATDLRIRTQGEFGGIGIHIGSQEGRLTVMSTIEGTPAYRAGLLAGDRFLEIEGKSAQNMTIRDAVNILRGEPGTQVRIKIERFGISEPLEFTLTRDIIRIKAVPYAGEVSPGIGYVRLADFQQSARLELEAALDSLIGKLKVNKLIFDLRGNGGGLLQEGFEVADLFLPKGTKIVTTDGQTPQAKRVFVSENPKPYLDIPLVVVVDRGSASAAEIAAGALQDWERAVVIGETTFGKGTVQTPIPMPYNATLKLTTALWRTPSGRCVDVRTGRDTAIGKQDTLFYTLGPNRRELRAWVGIVPDAYVPYPRLSEFEAKIRPEWAFEYAVRYATEHPALPRDFAITPEMFAGFKTLMHEKKLEFTDTQADSAREYIERVLRINIASKLWGTTGEYQARLLRDEQVLKACELLAESKATQDLFDALARSARGKK